MRNAVKVDDLAVESALELIIPLALLVSLHEIRMLPGGVPNAPDKDIDPVPPAAIWITPLAIVDVPSQILHTIESAVELFTVTVPLAYHVPVDPWVSVGPSKYNEVLFIATFDAIEFTATFNPPRRAGGNVPLVIFAALVVSVLQLVAAFDKLPHAGCALVATPDAEIA